MAYRIFWTPIAVQDLRDICNFISRDNPVAAQRMGEQLIEQAEAIALFPQSGRMIRIPASANIVNSGRGKGRVEQGRYDVLERV
jgi:plasmid stabilization system protein ParE